MYMSMGMTYSEFWDGDATMVIAYRRAYERRRRERNFDAWLNGRYIYEAFVVAYSNAWSKSKSDLLEYPAKPHPLTQEDADRERQEEERLKMERVFSYMARKVAVQKKEAQENG